MEASIVSTHLQIAVQETCRFFMQVFKNDDLSELPDYDVIYQNYGEDSKIKIISYVISIAIDLFCHLPTKYFIKFVDNKVGTWRAIIVKTCQAHGADIHHLPLEIDIFAARNHLAIDCLIFEWPFCSNVLSQLLEFLTEAFHETSTVSQPYLDEYLLKYSKKSRRNEAYKIIANVMKWLHSTKRSPSYDKTKEIMKEYVVSLLTTSEVIMNGKEGQYDEVWLEITKVFDITPDFEKNRIDSFLFYCRINPVIDELTAFIKTMYGSETLPDFSKFNVQIAIHSEIYDNRDNWGMELNNAILTAINTVLTPALFRKQRSFPKKFENNFKMFINLLSETEPINQLLIFSEINYWIERFKRKKMELPISIDDYCPEFINNILTDSAYAKSLEEYFTKVLSNELIQNTPGMMNSDQYFKESKQLQKIILSSLKNAATNLAEDDPYFPPISSHQLKLIIDIAEKIGENMKLTLQEHFSEKISRTIERFNINLIKMKEVSVDIDDKSLIIPLFDDFDYRKFTSLIWRYVNLEYVNDFFRPNSSCDYLKELKNIISSQLNDNSVDRLLCRLMFYVGWRFRLRFQEICLDEIFRFQLAFFFVAQNVEVGQQFHKYIKTWTLSFQSYDASKFENDPKAMKYVSNDDFFAATKLEVVKNRMVDILRGVKNLSISSLKINVFPMYKRGLESTKSLIQCVRLAFGKLNEMDREKSDSSKTYLANVRILEADIPPICNQLEADTDQVIAEIQYMTSIIKRSIKDPAILSRLESKSTNRESSPKKRKHLKKEDEENDEDDNYLDRKYSRSVKRAKHEYNAYGDMEYDDVNSRYDQPTTLQTKVNFINFRDPSSLHISIGDMLESRISYATEPNPRTICIDQGKDKARPARFVEISACPHRVPADIVKKPRVCQKRIQSELAKKESKSLYNFKVTREIAHGAYGKICEAIDKFSDLRVALKRITLNRYTEEGIPQSILRETTILRTVSHENIVKFVDVVVDDLESIKSQVTQNEMIVPKSFYFVFEYMEHDLQGLMKSKNMIFSYEQIGFLAKQLFRALEYLHCTNIIHRDITPSNILINKKGHLQLCDFGNARFMVKDVTMSQAIHLTPKSVPLFYRAPELLLELDNYGYQVDVWSAGCVLYEMLAGKPLFRFVKDAALIEMIEEISRVCGSPNQSVWTEVTTSKHYVDLATTGVAVNYGRKIDEIMKSIPYDAADVMKQIFMWDPTKRMSAGGALGSNWLDGVSMESINTEEFPEFDCHEFLLEHGDIVPVQGAGDDMDICGSQSTGHDEDIHNDETASAAPVDEEQRQQDEEMKKFVQNLSGRILELSEVLDKFRLEQPYTAEIGRGIVMHAARKWSNTEAQRIKLVEFMLNYLLSDQEKDYLKF